MRFLTASLFLGLLLAIAAPEAGAYPLTLEQRERLKQYLPRTFPKLEDRAPIHVVALGDDVMGGYTPLPSAWESNNPLYSYCGSFLTHLAREFFYPGGVRLLNPPQGGSAKLSEYLGDEIALENLTNIDGTVFDGLRRVHTDALLHDPDLVLVQYGIYDAFTFLSIDTYKRALQEIVETVRTARSDLILFSPPMVNYGGGAMEWGIERPYATAAREVAEANGVLYIDLGRHLSRFGASAPVEGIRLGVVQMGQSPAVGGGGVGPVVEPLDVPSGGLDGGGVRRPFRGPPVGTFVEPSFQSGDPLVGGEQGRRVAASHLGFRRTQFGAEPIPLFRSIPSHAAI